MPGWLRLCLARAVLIGVHVASIAVLLVFAFGALYISYKLYRMAAIRGWMPGATYKEHVVTDKRVLPSEFGPAYWIAWDAADITRRSNSRENLEADAWNSIGIGDRVTMAYFRDEPDPYKPDGIYAANENFQWDFGLLAVETIVVLLLLRRFRRRA